MARFLLLEANGNASEWEAPELDFGSDGRFLRRPLIEYELGELLCWDTWGRGTLAKRLSSELVSVDEGSVEVEPCWPFV